MTTNAEILVWRGQCPACGERVVSSRQRACPECGLDEPREAVALARPQAAPWSHRGSTARSSIWLGASGATGTLAVVAGGPASAIALSLGVFLMAAMSLLMIGMAAHAHRRKVQRYERRMLRRNASALQPQARAIGEARANLETQIARLVEIIGRIDAAISQREDDAAARRRLAMIRGTVEAAIQARTMTMTQLEAAAAEIGLARWLCRLAMLTEEVQSIEDVPVRLAESIELEHGAKRAIRGLQTIGDSPRRRQVEDRWARAMETLAEVRQVLRAEEERLLAVMVQEAVQCVRPIATMDIVPLISVPRAARLVGEGPGGDDLLTSRLSGVRDEVQRCIDEEHRLRAEIDALVEVERLAAAA